MTSDERARLVAAFGRVAAECGCRELTLDRVAKAAGLPRERLDAHFGSKEEGLLAAQGEFLARLKKQSLLAAEPAWEWSGKVRLGLAGTIGYLEEGNALARALMVEATGEWFVAAERQLEALHWFSVRLREGRRRHPAAAALPPRAERFLVGGIASIVSEQLRAEDPNTLRTLEPQLAEMLLSPFLGPDAARRLARSP